MNNSTPIVFLRALIGPKSAKMILNISTKFQSCGGRQVVYLIFH